MVLEFAVTGGAGFIGSHLARALLEKGSVVIIDDFTTGKKENLPEGARFVEASVLDEAALKAMERADCVFHLAGMVGVPLSVREPARCKRVNVEGTRRVAEAASGRVIFASSSALYGQKPNTPSREGDPLAPASPYAESKLEAEEILSRRGNSVSLRLFNIYGPRQSIESGYAAVVPAFLKAAKANEPLIIHGDGLQTRDFVFVEDAVRAFILASEKGSGAYNIGSGKATSVKELAEKIIELTGSKSELKFEESRAGDVHDSLADTTKVGKELNFKARCSLEEGLKKVIESE